MPLHSFINKYNNIFIIDLLFWKVSIWFIYTFIHTHTSHYMYVCSATQLCLTLCNPMECSLLGLSVHGIFQARILKWVAISFFRGSSWYRDRSCFPLSPALSGRFFATEPSTTMFIMLPSSYKTIFGYHSQCFYYGNINRFMVRHEVRLIFFSNALWFPLE